MSTASFAGQMCAWGSESELQGRFTFSRQTTLDFGHFSKVNWYVTTKGFCNEVAWSHSTSDLTVRPQFKEPRETFRCFGKFSVDHPCASHQNCPFMYL